MAGALLRMIPGFLGSMGGSEGILDKLKNAAGNIFSDLGSGKVTSGAEFGKSLARAAAGALGHTPSSNAADKIAGQVAEGAQRMAAKNAADEQIINIGPSHPALMRTLGYEARRRQLASAPKSVMLPETPNIASPTPEMPLPAPGKSKKHKVVYVKELDKKRKAKGNKHSRR